MSKKSDVIAEIEEYIMTSKQIDRELGVICSDTTTVCKDILKSVRKIDSLD